MGFRVLRGRVSWVLQREALLLTQKLQLCVEAGTRRQEGLLEEEGELSPAELPGFGATLCFGAVLFLTLESLVSPSPPCPLPPSACVG